MKTSFRKRLYSLSVLTRISLLIFLISIRVTSSTAQCDFIEMSFLEHDTSPDDENISGFTATPNGMYYIVPGIEDNNELHYVDEHSSAKVFDTKEMTNTDPEIKILARYGDKIAIAQGAFNQQKDLYIIDGNTETSVYAGTTDAFFPYDYLHVVNDSAALFEQDDQIMSLSVEGDLEMLIDGDFSFTHVPIPNGNQNRVILSTSDGIYLTDGTPENTQQLLGNGYFSDTHEFAYSSDFIYFVANGELYRTDLSGELTEHLSDDDLWPNEISNVYLVEHGLIITGESNEYGGELWLTDGTADSIAILQDFLPGAGHGVGFATEFINLAGRLIFQPRDGDDKYHIWQSDGSRSGTFVFHNDLDNVGAPYNYPPEIVMREKQSESGFVCIKEESTDVNSLWYFDIEEAPDGLMSDLGEIALAEDRSWLAGNLLFTHSVPNGSPFLKIDGSSGNVDTLLEEVEHLTNWHVDEDWLAFRFRQLSGTSNSNIYLASTNNSVEDGGVLLSENPPSGYNWLRGGFATDESLNFLSYDDDLGSVSIQYLFDEGETVVNVDLQELTRGVSGYKVIGKAAGHLFFTDSSDDVFYYRKGMEEAIPMNVNVSFPTMIGHIEEYVLIQNSSYGEIYVANVLTNEVTLITGGEQGFTSDGIVYNDRIYFKKNLSITSDIVYWTPGTNALISILTYEKISNDYPSGGQNELVVFNDLLYFPWSDLANGNELWFSDGSVGNGELAVDLLPGVESSYPDVLSPTQDILAIAAGNLAHNCILRTDGTLFPIVTDEDQRILNMVEMNDYYLLYTKENLYSLSKNLPAEPVPLLSANANFTINERFSSLQLLNPDTALVLFKEDNAWDIWQVGGSEAELTLIESLGSQTTHDPIMSLTMNGDLYYTYYEAQTSYLKIRNVVTGFVEEFAGHHHLGLPLVIDNYALYLANHPVSGLELHTISCRDFDSTFYHLTLYQDQNQNNTQDPGEPTISNLPVNVSGYEDLLIFSNASGQINYPLVREETYGFEFLLDDCWAMATLDTNYLEITLDSLSPDSISIGLISTGEPAAASGLLTSGPTRCGFTVPFWFSTRNVGCVAGEFVTSLQLPEEATLITANLPFETGPGENEFTWSLGELETGELRQINLELEMPGEEFVGETLEILAVSGLAGQESGLDTFHFASTITCAIDPNDKLVHPSRPEPGMNNYTQLDEELTYTVRFQNTGNDTAFTVRIEDQLSPLLDWNTVRPVTASHPYEMQLDESGLLTVLFENILLPDSSTNLIRSQGFVTIKVAMLDGLEDFTLLENTAAIYFDFNAPIITNTVASTAVEFLDFDQDGFYFWNECDDLDETINPLAVEIPNNGIDENCDGVDGPVSVNDLTRQSIQAFPNPTTGLMRLQLTGDWPEVVDYQLVNLAGQSVASGRYSGVNPEIDLAALPPGAYFLSVYHQKEGRWYRLKLLRS